MSGARGMPLHMPAPSSKAKFRSTRCWKADIGIGVVQKLGIVAMRSYRSARMLPKHRLTYRKTAVINHGIWYLVGIGH